MSDYTKPITCRGTALVTFTPEAIVVRRQFVALARAKEKRRKRARAKAAGRKLR